MAYGIELAPETVYRQGRRFMATTESSSRGRTYAGINLAVVIGVVFWNYWTARFGFQGRTVGGMSDDYRTLFTPAGYAFSIWGLIFLGLLVNAGYQLWLAFGQSASSAAPSPAQKPSPSIVRPSSLDSVPWLIATNIANGLWIVLWLSEQTAASVLTLGAMFVFLTVAMRKLDMETWDAPLEVIGFVWWPIVVYAGWVTVAVLANLTAFLAKHDVVPGDSVGWALAMIALATIINLFLVATRNLREHALVAVWALIAIGVRQQDGSPTVRGGAFGAALLLVLAVFAHAFKNRRTLPFVRRA